MSDKKKLIWISGSIIVFLAAVIVVPKLMKKYTGKLYKNSHKTIDFEDFGPEIVKKETEEVNENGN